MNLYACVFANFLYWQRAGITYDVYGESLFGEGNCVILHSRTPANIAEYDHANILAGFRSSRVSSAHGKNNKNEKRRKYQKHQHLVSARTSTRIAPVPESWDLNRMSHAHAVTVSDLRSQRTLKFPSNFFFFFMYFVRTDFVVVAI